MTAKNVQTPPIAHVMAKFANNVPCAPIPQSADGTDSKSVKCGFESH